jgi:hypothetical protein
MIYYEFLKCGLNSEIYLILKEKERISFFRPWAVFWPTGLISTSLRVGLQLAAVLGGCRLRNRRSELLGLDRSKEWRKREREMRGAL